MDFEQWKGFEKGEWKRKIDVRNFIQKNYTPYEGNATFLTGTTEKTKKLWDEVLKLYEKERNSNGSRRVLVKGIGFCMTLTCTRYDVAILLRIMMLYYNTSTKTLDQKCQLTQVAADVCLHFMVVVLQLMFLTSPTLPQKT